MQPRNFDFRLDEIVDAMPPEFDAHQAQQWYQRHHADDFQVDLARYGGNEHVLARELSKAIDVRPDVVQIGKSLPSTNLRGRISTCTKWRKLMVTA